MTLHTGHLNTLPYPVMYIETTSRGRLAGRAYLKMAASLLIHVENNINPAYTLPDGHCIPFLQEPVM
jgi:hypothetical protein